MEARSEPRRQRDVVIGGFVLAIIGAAALIAEFFPSFSRYVPLAIGLGLLLVFALARSYLALVGGGILTGLGGGLVIAAVVGTNADGPGVVLGLAAGFIGVWLISSLLGMKERHWWPLIPGGILLVVGTGLAVEAAGSTLAQWFVPAVVLVAGVAIMVLGYFGVRRTGTGQSA